MTLALDRGCLFLGWPGWGGVVNGLRWGTDVRRRGKYSSLRTGSYRAVRRVAYATRVVLTHHRRVTGWASVERNSPYEALSLDMPLAST